MKPKPYVLERYRLLAKLPFRSYLTTNYERSVLSAIKKHRGNGQHSSYPDLQVTHGRGRVFFLHGSVPDDPCERLRIVLTATEFEVAYLGSFLRSFLVQTFPFHNVCFMGCSLEDEYLQEILRFCHAWRIENGDARSATQNRWFILLDEQAAIPADFDQCGIQVVRYEKLNQNHDGLTDLIREWTKREPVQQRSPLESIPDLYSPQEERPL